MTGTAPALALGDPGPVARFEAVKERPEVPEEIFHRLCEGDSLREIAKAWGLPRGPFTLWFMSEHKQLFDDAERVRAHELKEEVLEIADEQKEVTRDGKTYDPEVPRDKLRVDARLKLMPHMDRQRFGVQDAVRTAPVVIQIANLREPLAVTVRAPEEPPG